jgi:enterobactin synthetase component D / holo-[acyl-carrier protein] synthase
MSLLTDLLPPFVSAVETREDRLDVELFPEEELVLGDAVEKRRREFVTGRACAREALVRFGFPPSPVGSGAKGEPLWPAGIVGSITHCEGYRAAAVARSSSALMLGIDAERNAPLREGVWEEVAHGRERQLADRGLGGGPHLDAVLFSAKEAIFKAWYPLARRWLGFGDAELTIDSSGAFTARLLVPGPEVSGPPLRELAGRWAADDDVVVTAVLVPSERETGIA